MTAIIISALSGALISALGVAIFRVKRNALTLANLILTIWCGLLLLARATVLVWAIWFS